MYTFTSRTHLFCFLLIYMFSVSCQSLKYEDAYPIQFDELSKPDGQFEKFEFEGQHLAYYDSKKENDGKVLLLLHGLGEHAGYWRVTTQALAQRHRVITVDLMGHGRSSKPAEKHFYSLKNQGEILSALLKHLSIKNVFLVGHSMGGQIAMHMALNHPDQINHLILLCPAGIEAFTAGEGQWLKDNSKPEGFESRDEGALRAHFQKYVFGKWSPEAEHHLAERVKLKKAQDFKAYTKAVVASIYAMIDEPVRNRLAQLAMPTTVIFGLSDALIPNRLLHTGGVEDILEETKKLIPKAHVIEMKGIGHMIQIEAIEDTNRILSQIVSLDKNQAP